MTPKEKAIDLIDSFELSFAGIISNDEDWEALAKQCALIAVDEIINSYNVLLDINEINNGAEHIFYEQNYWQEVKQEIQKL